MQEGLIISGENVIAIAVVGAGEDAAVTGGTALFGGWSTTEGGFIDGNIRECLCTVRHRIGEGFSQVGDKKLGAHICVNRDIHQFDDGVPLE